MYAIREKYILGTQHLTEKFKTEIAQKFSFRQHSLHIMMNDYKLLITNVSGVQYQVHLLI